MNPSLLHLLQAAAQVGQGLNGALLAPKHPDIAVPLGAAIIAFAAWVQQTGNKAEPPPPKAS